MWSKRRKAVRANTVNNADTERDRAMPMQDIFWTLQDIDMYVHIGLSNYVDRIYSKSRSR